MSNAPSDPHLASFPRPPLDNGRGIHFPLDARPADFARWAQAINALKFRWVTVYGQNENIVCDVALNIKQNCRGAVSVLRAEASDAPNHRKTPDFFGVLAKKAAAMGLPPYIQIGNEPEAEWGNRNKWAGWWSASASACVAAGGYAGLQVLSEDYFAAVAGGMSDAVKQKLFICAHGQAANHPPAYPYDARNQQDHPGATAATDTTCMLIPLAFGEWFTKYLGGLVVPLIVTEGPWDIDGDGSGSGQGKDTRYPPNSFQNWANYVYATYEQFRTGVLANGQPLPDYWFAENYWLLYDGGGFMNNGMIGSWFPEKKQPLVDKLTNDAPYVRQFGGAPVPPPPTPPPTALAQGIDVSHYQGAIDWAKVKAAGISFVFIKATEGTTLQDDQFAANWAGAKAQGILRGAYHYFINSLDPTTQAQAFLKVLGKDLGELPPVVDVEDKNTPGDPDHLLAFCQTVQAATGVKPIIYTGKWYWDDQQYWDHAFHWTGGNDLWIADYSGAPAPALPSDWTTWRFWQSGQAGTAPASGSVAGISAPVDLDTFNGTIADLQAYAASIVPSPTSPPTPPPSSSVIVSDVPCPWLTVTQGQQVKVRKVYFYDADKAQNRVLIYARCESADGRPADFQAIHLLNGGDAVDWTIGALGVNFAQSGGGVFDPAHGAGPYSVACGDARVSGLGLPVARHVQYSVVFTVPDSMLR